MVEPKCTSLTCPILLARMMKVTRSSKFSFRHFFLFIRINVEWVSWCIKRNFACDLKNCGWSIINGDNSYHDVDWWHFWLKRWQYTISAFEVQNLLCATCLADRIKTWVWNVWLMWTKGEVKSASVAMVGFGSGRSSITKSRNPVRIRTYSMHICSWDRWE